MPKRKQSNNGPHPHKMFGKVPPINPELAAKLEKAGALVSGNELHSVQDRPTALSPTLAAPYATQPQIGTEEFRTAHLVTDETGAVIKNRLGPTGAPTPPAEQTVITDTALKIKPRLYAHIAFHIDGEAIVTQDRPFTGNEELNAFLEKVRVEGVVFQHKVKPEATYYFAHSIRKVVVTVRQETPVATQ